PHNRERSEELPGHGDQQRQAGRVLHRHGIAHQVDQAVPDSARERLAQRDVGAVVVEGPDENPARGPERHMGEEHNPRDEQRLALYEDGPQGGVLELWHPPTSGPRLYGSRSCSGTPPWPTPPAPAIAGS